MKVNNTYSNSKALFSVGIGSNLAVFVLPDSVNADIDFLKEDSPSYAFDVHPDQKPFPTFPALTVSLPPSRSASPPSPIVTIASGRVYGDGKDGDAVWFIFFNNDSSTTLRRLPNSYLSTREMRVGKTHACT